VTAKLKYTVLPIPALLVGAALVAGLVPLLLDSIIYVDFVSSKASVSSLVLAALSVLGLVLLNSWRPGQLHRFGQVLLGAVYPLLVTVIIFLGWQEERHFPNFVFSRYHLVLAQLPWLAVYATAGGAALLDWSRVRAGCLALLASGTVLDLADRGDGVFFVPKDVRQLGRGRRLGRNGYLYCFPGNGRAVRRQHDQTKKSAKTAPSLIDTAVAGSTSCHRLTFAGW